MHTKSVNICLQNLKWKNSHKICDYLPPKFKVEKMSTIFLIICFQNLNWKKSIKICDYLPAKFKVEKNPTIFLIICLWNLKWKKHFPMPNGISALQTFWALQTFLKKWRCSFISRYLINSCKVARLSEWREFLVKLNKSYCFSWWFLWL